MEKWGPLNMELRSWVISLTLRLEQTSSEAIKAILRMFKKESKTLGNQSSALSFKSKIDLLYDLDELTKKEYTHLLKLAEIRNQFAHNHNAVSFESFDTINPDINKYLLKNCPEELKEEPNNEKKLKSIFGELFKQTAGKLIAITVDYQSGIEKDIRQHISESVVENIDEIWKNALGRNADRKAETPILYLLGGNDNELDSFYNDFKISLSEFQVQEIDKLEGKENLVLKKKMTIEERFAKRKKK